MTPREGQGDLLGVAYPAGLAVLPGFVLGQAAELVALIGDIAGQAPFRHMVTPGGHAMSAAMTNCGQGWVTDRKGYRYAAEDPLSGKVWPAMPELFFDVARRAAEVAGFENFVPDGCLINRYAPGAKMGLHQDTDEGDLTAPIVSVSLGLEATFLFGGLRRTDPTQKIVVRHGDVVVWGGPARLAFHGVAALKPGVHPAADDVRYNLTLRKARLK